MESSIGRGRVARSGEGFESAVAYAVAEKTTNQALVVVKGTAIAKAKSIADLKPYKLGAQLGTTSYNFIKDNIQPSKQPGVFDANDAAVQSLKNKKIDGLVVDLPTAFFVTAVQVPFGFGAPALQLKHVPLSTTFWGIAALVLVYRPMGHRRPEAGRL